MRTVLRFQMVKARRTFRWVDASGKKRSLSKTFTHTINPFNVNAAGLPKSYGDVMRDVNKEADQWLEQQTGDK